MNPVRSCYDCARNHLAAHRGRANASAQKRPAAASCRTLWTCLEFYLVSRSEIQMIPPWTSESTVSANQAWMPGCRRDFYKKSFTAESVRHRICHVMSQNAWPAILCRFVPVAILSEHHRAHFVAAKERSFVWRAKKGYRCLPRGKSARRRN